MRAGELRNLLKIERKVAAGKDSLGMPIVDWHVFRRMWGGVVATRGAEAMSADFQRYQQTLYRFRVRRAEADGVDPTMRIAYGGSYYDIRNLLPDEQAREDCIIEATVQGKAV